MRQDARRTYLKFGIFAVVMSMLTAFLLLIFGQFQIGSANRYSAVFSDISGLRNGDSVRAGGLRVGTVGNLSMQSDHSVVVTFDVDRAVPISAGTKLAVRYLNLVGDRYLELVDGPGSGKIQPPATGNYTFYTTSDDGIRLWVDGQQIVNNWTDGYVEGEMDLLPAVPILYRFRVPMSPRPSP